jgi:hypothetical protein
VSAATEVIERLAVLSRRDRDWILRNLSEAARNQLRMRAADERANGDGPAADSSGVADRPAAGAAVPAAEASERQLESLAGDRVTRALAAEPPWLLAAVLGLRSWPWEAAALARTSAATRVEIGRLRLGAPRVSPALRELLMQSLLEKVAANNEPSMSGFERLLHSARFSERSRR